MKKYLLAALVLVLVTGLTVASTIHYREYQSERQAVVTVDPEKDRLKDQVQSLTTESTKTLTENERLLAECEKGRVAYEKLTAFQKTQTQVPNCAPVQ